MFDALDGFKAAHGQSLDTERAGQSGIERVFHQRALSGSGDSCDADQHAGGNAPPGPSSCARWLPRLRGLFPSPSALNAAPESLLASEVACGDRTAVAHEVCGRRSAHDFTFFSDCGSSTIWSADSIIWRSCSTTTTVFPAAARSFKMPAKTPCPVGAGRSSAHPARRGSDQAGPLVGQRHVALRRPTRFWSAARA